MDNPLFNDDEPIPFLPVSLASELHQSPVRQTWKEGNVIYLVKPEPQAKQPRHYWDRRRREIEEKKAPFNERQP